MSKIHQGLPDKEILEGKHDDLPEGAFYMVGTIDDAIAKAKSMEVE